MSTKQVQQITNQLWEMANNLRGNMDASEFKNYILAFMFYRYLSERQEQYLIEQDLIVPQEEESFNDAYRREASGEDAQEYAEDLALSIGHAIAPEHTWTSLIESINQGEIVPKDYQDMFESFNANMEINKDATKDFRGLFNDINLGDSRLGSSTVARAKALNNIALLVDGVEYKTDSGKDILGDIYEYLIGQFAASAGKKGGEFYTPHEVSVVLARIVTHGIEASTKAYSLFDPTMGSGHFLAYEFDVLIEIYRERGYNDRDAVKNIVNKNLYGLDIDERAYQLAYFSIMMKARQYDRRVFSRNLKPNIYVFEDSNNIDRDLLENLGTHLSENDRKEAKRQLDQLLDEYEDAKLYGSILVLSEYDFDLIRSFLDAENDTQLTLTKSSLEEVLDVINMIICSAELLKDKYHVVATNPPYLNKMDARLKKYANKYYKDYKTDLFSIFIFKSFEFNTQNGYSGLMVPNVWMFIKSYEKLRVYIIDNKHIDSLIQIAKGAFYSDSTVDVMTYVAKNSHATKNGFYIKLDGFKGNMDVQKLKVLEAIGAGQFSYTYNINQEEFKSIPGSPFAFWTPKNLIIAFKKGKPIEELLDVKQGLATADNDRFLRFWWEINYNNICFDAKNSDEALASKKK